MGAKLRRIIGMPQIFLPGFLPPSGVRNVDRWRNTLLRDRSQEEQLEQLDCLANGPELLAVLNRC